MALNNKKDRILVVIQKDFYLDSRPLREVAALIDHGYRVDVICLRQPKQNPRAPENKQLRLYTFPLNRKRGSRMRYLFEYFFFFCYASVVGLWLYFRNSYKLIQIFVMPEMLVLCGLFQKLFGSKILMDWEDPSREVYLAKFDRKLDFLFLPIITLIEKISVRLADVIITPNEGFREAFIARGLDGRKIKIVMNAPDKRIFNRAIKRNSPSSNNKFNILYYGGILKRHGLDIAIKALGIILHQIPYARLVILGSGEEDFIEYCHSLTKRLNIEGQVDWRGLVGIKEIPEALQDATVAVIPNRENPFTKINFPQRIMECGCLKVPLVVSRLPGIEQYMDDKSICYFEPENHQDLAEKIINLYKYPDKLDAFAENAYKICQQLDWEQGYLDIVNDLTGDKSRSKVSCCPSWQAVKDTENKYLKK